MAKDKTPNDPPADDAPAVPVKARVLSDCAYGLHGEVIKIDPALAASCLLLDTDPSAVAYAESLLAAKAD